jgi:hypothetical protein
MVKIFTKRDSLLSSEGPITPYYWLVRNLKSNHELVREFLVNFEEQRKTSRKQEREPAGLVDDELREYDLLNRATNDVGSLSRRYAILLRRMRQFLIARGLDPQALEAGAN